MKIKLNILYVVYILIFIFFVLVFNIILVGEEYYISCGLFFFFIILYIYLYKYIYIYYSRILLNYYINIYNNLLKIYKFYIYIYIYIKYENILLLLLYNLNCLKYKYLNYMFIINKQFNIYIKNIFIKYFIYYYLNNLIFFSFYIYKNYKNFLFELFKNKLYLNFFRQFLLI